MSLYSEVKYIDPQTFAQLVDHRHHPKPLQAAQSHQQRTPEQSEGTDHNKVSSQVIQYLTDVLADDAFQTPETAGGQTMPVGRPPADLFIHGASQARQRVQGNAFNKKLDYFPETYEQPAQQLRPATEEDIERLRNSMDDNTNRLTPKQMAFWEKLSLNTNNKAIGINSGFLNSNQVSIKYDSVPPEQSVFFDPTKSVNLMIPEAEPDSPTSKLY